MMNYWFGNYGGSGMMGPWGMSGYWGWGSPFGMHQLMYSWFGGYWWLAVLAFCALLVWSIVWKGMALWKAAREGHTVWFVILLIANTVGILDILYLYVFSKRQKPVHHQ